MPSYEQPINHPYDSQPPTGEWGYTVDADQLAEIRRMHEKKAGVDLRHSIGSDRRINRGVYEGIYGGEAIVVDREKYPAGYNEAMNKVLALATNEAGRVNKGDLLNAVFDTVTETMRYDADAVEEIFQTLGHGKDGVKIALDQYIADGVGVCRHQALFAAQLLEGLKDTGYVSGDVSIERNQIQTADDQRDGHSWVRYTNSAGQVIILDIAQERIDTLDNLMESRQSGEKIWDYARPEDYARREVESALHHNAGQERKVNGTRAIEQVSGSPESTELFNARHASVMAEIDRAIEQAGYIDPCMNALRISSSLDQMYMIPNLPESVVSQIRAASDLGQEIGNSGTDTRSPYHRNERSGLANLRRLVQAIRL